MRLGEFEPRKKLTAANFHLTLRQYQQRRLFLKEIEHSSPVVLRSLYEEVYLPYRAYLPLDYAEIEKLYERRLLENWEREKLGPKGSRVGREVWALKGAELTDDLALEREIEASRVWLWDHEILYWYGVEIADEGNYPELVHIRDYIVQWSKRWNLDTAWCCELALSTLHYWQDMDNEGIPNNLGWSLSGWGKSIECDKAEELKLLPSESFPRWLPFETRQSQYLNDLKERLMVDITKHPIMSLGIRYHLKSHTESWIDSIIKEVRQTYCKKVADLYEANGYERITERPQANKHIEWAVQVQVKGATYAEIAIQSGTDTANVSRRVNALLKYIQLPPRRDLLPGRPKGSKDSKPRNIARR